MGKESEAKDSPPWIGEIGRLPKIVVGAVG